MQAKHPLKEVGRELDTLWLSSVGQKPATLTKLVMMQELSGMIHMVLSQNATLMVRLWTEAQQQRENGQHRLWATLMEGIHRQHQSNGLSGDLEKDIAHYDGLSEQDQINMLAKTFGSFAPSGTDYKRWIHAIDQFNLLGVSPTSCLQHSYDHLNKMYAAKAPRNVPGAVYMVSASVRDHAQNKPFVLDADKRSEHMQLRDRVYDAAAVYQQSHTQSTTITYADLALADEPLPIKNGADLAHSEELYRLCNLILEHGVESPDVLAARSYYIGQKEIKEVRQSNLSEHQYSDSGLDF